MTAPKPVGGDRPWLSIALMVCGMLIAPVGDIAAKLLSASLPVVEIAWLRSVGQVLLLCPFIHALHRSWPRRLASDARTFFLMGSLWAMSTLAFFTAIKHNPVPNSLAVFFVCPIAVTALAPALLGERFRLGRLAAVLAGFVGVLFVLRPGGDYHPTILLSLVAGVCYGLYLMGHRKLSRRIAPLEKTFISGLTSLVLPLPLVLWLWEWPGAQHLPMLAVLALATAGSHYLIALASEFADASVYAPFNYVEIVSATVISWLVFRTFPDLWAWVGIAFVIGSGLYLIWRERKVVVGPDQFGPM